MDPQCSNPFKGLLFKGQLYFIANINEGFPFVHKNIKYNI